MSALFGALRLGDRVPAYRVNICSTLPGVGYLSHEWRKELPNVVAIIQGACPSAFYSVEEIQSAEAGIFPTAPRRVPSAVPRLLRPVLVGNRE